MCSANSSASQPLSSRYSSCSFLLPDRPLLEKQRSHLLNHSMINAVPNVFQLHGQLVYYFLLAIVLANAILLGLRRWIVICINRKEFERNTPLTICEISHH